MNDSNSGDAARGSVPWLWLLAAGCVIVLLIGMFWPRAERKAAPPTDRNFSQFTATADASRMPRDASGHRLRSQRVGSIDAPVPAELVVSNKVSQFGRNR